MTARRTWPSPISSDAVAAGGLRLSDLQFDGDDIYWIEGRPAEHGRCAIVRWRDGHTDDLIDAPFSARTAVHEYGGGALLVSEGTAYFSNAADRRVHIATGEGSARPLTPDLGDVRYADMISDAGRARLIAVVEDHRSGAAVNDIRAVPLDGGEPTTLVGGNDFYSTPRLSPDGTQLCWLAWNQPNMPWDGTELWLADVDGGGELRDARCVTGGPEESIFQSSWSPDGTVFFCSDRTGWWNLYRLDGDAVTPVAPMDAECGKPGWLFGLSTYSFCDTQRIALAVCRQGIWELGSVARDTGEWAPINLPYSWLTTMTARGARIAAIAAGPRDPSSVVLIDIDTGEHSVLRRGGLEVDAAFRSEPQAITFPGHGGDTAHAFYYAPRSATSDPPGGTQRPLIVNAHGGPTSAIGAALEADIQYWTSRGFSFLNVNYGGSTGYGRRYRERLTGMTGVVDTGDCVAGARFLAERGDVDPQRLVIRGGSAGGYIVLCAMTFHDELAAGTSYFGIADWEILEANSHKFEAKYNHKLIGPYPQRRDLYYERSPIHFIDRVRRAVLLLQGLDDPIVPANQAELMFGALRDAGLPCAYIAFPGEQHGFRDAANIKRSLEAELYFYCRVLGLELAEDVEPVEIENLDVAVSDALP